MTDCTEDAAPWRVVMPIVDYLVLGDDPHLVATRCVGCGATYLGRRSACGSCGAADFGRVRLDNQGAVRAFTIVHRAAKGVDVPFVSALVDVGPRACVKANLIGVKAAPGPVELGMRVELATYRVAENATTEVVAFGYKPKSLRPAT